MSKFKTSTFVRLIEPGFAETGRIGKVIMTGTASCQVDFPVYGSSQLLDDWLEPVPDSLETFVLGLRLDRVSFWEEGGRLKWHSFTAIPLKTVIELNKHRGKILSIVERNEWAE